MVLDNHKAHKNKGIIDFAHSLGFELEFMPPTASELNPVERMWAYFKRKWRQKLYDPKLDINNHNSRVFIEDTLEQIKYTGIDRLTEGPMSHMKTCLEPLDYEKPEDAKVGDFIAQSRELHEQAQVMRAANALREPKKIKKYYRQAKLQFKPPPEVEYEIMLREY